LSQSNTHSHSFNLPAEVEATFELFSDPQRLNALTPGWFDLVPVSRSQQTLAPGVEIDYRLRWRSLPMRWTSRITDWEPPHRLTYEQVRGPYRLFRHEHSFEPEGRGTRVIDKVLYRAPGGRLIDRLLVRPDLERIFRHREHAARRILGPGLPGLQLNAAAGPN
jgi:ligand-binding SRPBCC domain-containing protein